MGSSVFLETSGPKVEPPHVCSWSSINWELVEVQIFTSRRCAPGSGVMESRNR